MEGVARYECVYHRNSKDFKEKNKRKLLENIGEKFNLSAAEAEVKFRNIWTAYSRYLSNISKTSASVSSGFKHEKTDESTRPQAECFYCFRVFETPMKHEAQVFEITSPTKEN